MRHQRSGFNLIELMIVIAIIAAIAIPGLLRARAHMFRALLRLRQGRRDDSAAAARLLLPALSPAERAFFGAGGDEF